MLYSTVTPTEKRRRLRDALASDRPLVLPGAFNALSARMIECSRFQGVYISGHMIAADLGLPDLGLTTATEVSQRAQQIARMTDLPAIVDADTGFGEPMSAARTVQTLEDAGLAGCHIEDQVNPKRCGHSEGVEVVDLEFAVRRIRAAVDARRDQSFVVIGRTDARSQLGLDETIARARAYVDAGADVVFPDALHSRQEFAAFRKSVDAPVIVNLNEFGRGEPLSVQEAADLGIDGVIYPMTLMRSAMGAAQRTLETLAADGSQRSAISGMQTKDELYDLLGYDAYTSFRHQGGQERMTELDERPADLDGAGDDEFTDHAPLVRICPEDRRCATQGPDDLVVAVDDRSGDAPDPLVDLLEALGHPLPPDALTCLERQVLTGGLRLVQRREIALLFVQRHRRQQDPRHGADVQPHRPARLELQPDGLAGFLPRRGEHLPSRASGDDDRLIDGVAQPPQDRSREIVQRNLGGASGDRHRSHALRQTVPIASYVIH